MLNFEFVISSHLFLFNTDCDITTLPSISGVYLPSLRWWTSVCDLLNHYVVAVTFCDKISLVLKKSWGVFVCFLPLDILLFLLFSLRTLPLRIQLTCCEKFMACEVLCILFERQSSVSPVFELKQFLQHIWMKKTSDDFSPQLFMLS